MIIDLMEWNEYIADDVPPGPMPIKIPLTSQQQAEITALVPGDFYTFRDTEYVFMGTKKEEATWTLLA